MDIVTLAMNMYSQGVDPELDFSDIPAITKVYEKVTGMQVYQRQPYSGALVFAAFSGSHQDAIAKGMKWRVEKNDEHWTVPYLPIDPTDVGRVYEADVIRINSQSGKGGIEYLMETRYSHILPPKMREVFGYKVKGVSDKAHKELQPEEIYKIFSENYLNVNAPMKVLDIAYEKEQGLAEVSFTVERAGRFEKVHATGNGRLNAVSNGLKQVLGKDAFSFEDYSEHSMEGRSTARAAAYVSVKGKDERIYWGAGVDSDILAASVLALISAVNNMLKGQA